VSSRDDLPEPRDGGRLDRAIEDAARSLRPKAPAGSLERIRERAADLASSIETAARAQPSEAPLDSLDVRIAAAARELRGAAPAELLDRIRAEASAQQRRFRMRLVRGVAALAAALLAGVWLWRNLPRSPTAEENPALLTSSALARSRDDEARLEGEAARLQARVSGDAALAENETARSLLEEVAFLDRAIDECRTALEWSPAHGHLREQVVELTGRRVDLLRRAEAAGRGGDGESGGPRG
jgi:hypothetical protein